MPLIVRNCPHIVKQGDISTLESLLTHKEKTARCNDCGSEGPNLWFCLYPECRWVGCSTNHLDHNTTHTKNNTSHCIRLNLSSERIWCYFCEHEVIALHVPSVSPAVSPNTKEAKPNKFSGDGYRDSDSLVSKLGRTGTTNRIDWEKGVIAYDKSGDSPDSTDSDESKEVGGKPRGLVGLQNIGNTCYMNAALQALSNVPPLTQFFLECDLIVNCILKDRKPGLSLSYLNFINEMWHKKTRGYVVPHSILFWIRTVHPMFRGYHQHDTQEFLRCFMDQLHEELKESIEDDRESLARPKGFGEQSSDEEDDREIDGTGSSQSDAEYETCDSGVSEQSSLSDEGERGTKRRYYRLSQSEKLRSKFANRSVKKSTTDDSFAQSQRSTQNSPTKHRAKKPMKTRSVISDIFDGKLLSNVQCLTCDRVSRRVETFQDLSLPIPSRDHIDMLHQGSLTPQKAGPCSDVVYVTNQSGWVSWFWQWMRSWFWGPVVSLHDCLSAFFSADELKGDNMYSCEKCNKLRNGIKFSKVLELPEILCVHLKRFRHELMFSSKIANYVSFPLDGLDMRPYMHKECVSKVTTYDLISVICHHGTAGGGHYTCYALNTAVNQWFEYDDQCVTQVSPETVKNCEAYVLFYKKSSPEMNQLREKTVELMDVSANELSHFNFFVSRQWINKFNTFSEPGPIDNSDFLCVHGGVNPSRAQYVDKISMPIPQDVWEYLYDKLVSFFFFFFLSI